MEKYINKLAAAGNLEGLQAYLADRPPGIGGAAGERPLSASADPNPKGEELSAEEKAKAKKHGLSEEQYLKSRNKFQARA